MSLEIVQVVQELGTVGGSSSVAYELAAAFGRAGIGSSVITSVVSSSVPRNVIVERVAKWIAWIPTRGVFRHIGSAIVFPAFTVAATIAVLRRRRSIVINHGDSLAGELLVVHAVNPESLAVKRRSGSWRWLFNPMHLWVSLRDRWLIGGAHCRMFVAVSARVSTELQHHYRVPLERIRVIPNGVDLDRFTIARPQRSGVREEFAIPPDATLLLFAGHEFHRKGLACAIEALGLLDDKFWLLVVGSDSAAPYLALAGAARDRLIFAGTRHDMPAIYAAADALVLPTEYETFSLVCIEAMASGVPVFATAVGGVEDYLRNGLNGYVIERDAGDIADKVGRAFADRAGLETMRRGARQTAQRYSWDGVSRMYIELVAQLRPE